MEINLDNIDNIKNITKISNNKLVFERGIYNLYKEEADKIKIHFSNIDSKRNIYKKVFFNFDNIDNLEIDGSDSLFVFHGDFASFLFNNCNNVKIKNFRIDYNVPTTVEMYVDKIEGNTVFYRIPNIFEYEIHGQEVIWKSEKDRSGNYYWTQNNSFNAHSITVFDLKEKYSKRYVLEDGPFNNVENIESLESCMKITYSRIPSAILENIMIALNASNNRDNAGFAIVESSNIELENIEFNYLHGFGLLIQMSNNIKFNNCKFIGNERHLVSSFADSIHISGCKGEIEIKNCIFEGSLDDSINIHGTFTRVESIKENCAVLRYVHHQQAGFKQFFKGDEVEFIDRETLNRVEDKKYIVKSVIQPGNYNEDLQFMKVEFTEILPDYLNRKYKGDARFVAENISYTPSVIISNCSFKNIPSRAILCTTRKQVNIENNIFKNITMSSIYISNDANEWYESGSVDNMIISDNIFKYSNEFLKKNDTKSIWVNPIISAEVNSYVHNDIQIINNIFEIEKKKAIVYKNVKNMVLSNNAFINKRK